MEYKAIVITDAGTEPVTVEELKSQLRLTGTAHDTMLAGLITASRQGVEKYLGRAIMTQSLSIYFDSFDAILYIPYPPLQSIASVKYYDIDGVQKTLDTSIYQVDLNSIPGRFSTAYGQCFPCVEPGRLSAVEINYIAGYGEAEDVPQPIKQLILGLAVNLFEQPETNTEIALKENKAYNYLAINYKIPVVH